MHTLGHFCANTQMQNLPSANYSMKPPSLFERL